MNGVPLFVVVPVSFTALRVMLGTMTMPCSTKWSRTSAVTWSCVTAM
jgi:hypothetical protein